MLHKKCVRLRASLGRVSLTCIFPLHQKNTDCSGACSGPPCEFFCCGFAWLCQNKQNNYTPYNISCCEPIERVCLKLSWLWIFCHIAHKKVFGFRVELKYAFPKSCVGQYDKSIEDTDTFEKLSNSIRVWKRCVFPNVTYWGSQKETQMTVVHCDNGWKISSILKQELAKLTLRGRAIAVCVQNKTIWVGPWVVKETPLNIT